MSVCLRKFHSYAALRAPDIDDGFVRLPRELLCQRPARQTTAAAHSLQKKAERIPVFVKGTKSPQRRWTALRCAFAKGLRQEIPGRIYSPVEILDEIADVLRAAEIQV